MTKNCHMFVICTKVEIYSSRAQNDTNEFPKGSAEAEDATRVRAMLVFTTSLHAARLVAFATACIYKKGAVQRVICGTSLQS